MGDARGGEVGEARGAVDRCDSERMRGGVRLGAGLGVALARAERDRDEDGWSVVTDRRPVTERPGW